MNTCKKTFHFPNAFIVIVAAILLSSFRNLDEIRDKVLPNTKTFYQGKGENNKLYDGTSEISTSTIWSKTLPIGIKSSVTVSFLISYSGTVTFDAITNLPGPLSNKRITNVTFLSASGGLAVELVVVEL